MKPMKEKLVIVKKEYKVIYSSRPAELSRLVNEHFHHRWELHGPPAVCIGPGRDLFAQAMVREFNG